MNDMVRFRHWLALLDMKLQRTVLETRLREETEVVFGLKQQNQLLKQRMRDHQLLRLSTTSDKDESLGGMAENSAKVASDRVAKLKARQLEDAARLKTLQDYISYLKARLRRVAGYRFELVYQKNFLDIYVKRAEYK